MDLDKNWFRGGVAADVYDDLRRKEKQLETFGEYKGSKHLSAQRRRIVDWILEVNRDLEKSHSERHQNCRNFHTAKLNVRSVHLAVYLFDHFLNTYYVIPEHVYLVAATSLIVAAKFEVQHSCVPSPKVMNQHIQANQRRIYSLGDFLHVEWLLLKCVDWRLHVPLSVDFLQYYETSFELVDNFSISNYRISSPNSIYSTYTTPAHRIYTPSPEPSSLIVDDWKNTAEFLINYSLKDLNFRRYKPSLIAGAAIAAARWYHGLRPFWTKKLSEVSGYNYDCLNPCLNYFLKKIDNERQQNPSAFPSPVCDTSANSSSSYVFHSANPPVSMPVTSPVRLPTPTVSPDLEYSSASLNYAAANSGSTYAMNSALNFQFNSVPPRPYAVYANVSSSTTMQRPIGTRLPPIGVPQTNQNVAYGCFANGPYATMMPQETLLVPAADGSVYHTTNSMPVFHILGTLAQSDNGRVVYLIKNNVGFCQQTVARAPTLPTVAAAPVRPIDVASSASFELIDLESNSRVANRDHSNYYQVHYGNASSTKMNVDVTSNHNYSFQPDPPRPYTRSMKRFLDPPAVGSAELLPRFDAPKTKRSRRK